MSYIMHISGNQTLLTLFTVTRYTQVFTVLTFTVPVKPRSPSHQPLQSAFRRPLPVKSPCKRTQTRILGFLVYNFHLHM